MRYSQDTIKRSDPHNSDNYSNHIWNILFNSTHTYHMVKLKRGDTIFLGLSDENMKRLKEGKPIRFNLKDLGLQDTTVYIFNGTDEQSMAEFLGTITPKDTPSPQNSKNN